MPQAALRILQIAYRAAGEHVETTAEAEFIALFAPDEKRARLLAALTAADEAHGAGYAAGVRAVLGEMLTAVRCGRPADEALTDAALDFAPDLLTP